MPYRLTFLLLLLAACAAPPPPSNPEMVRGGEFPNLSQVPKRPEISIPLYDRLEMENELTQTNAAARKLQQESGLAADPVLPENPPAIPAEIAE